MAVGATVLLVAALLASSPSALPAQPLPWEGDPGRAAPAEVRELGPDVRPLPPDVRDLAPSVEALVEERPQEAEVVLGSDVLFAFDSAELPPEAATQLAGVVAQVRERRPALVRVEGHTDGVADESYNQGLSEQRAAAVSTALVGLLGADAPAFEQAGFGETQPLVPEVTPSGEDDPAARARNRRVSITLVQTPP